MKRGCIFIFICLVYVLTFECNNSNPTGPSVPDPVITPDNMKLQTREEFEFTASGGDRVNYQWSLPAGGGSLEQGSSAVSIKLKVGTALGNYRIKVESGNKSAETPFEVINYPYLEVNKLDPVSNSTVQVGKTITIYFKYSINNASGTSIMARLSVDGVNELTCSQISGYGNGHQSGSKNMQIIIDNLCQGNPTITNYIILRMQPFAPPYIEVLKIAVPAKYTLTP